MRIYLLLAAIPTALLAQQTIFDVPSADVSAPRDSIASFGFKTSVPLNGREAPLPAKFIVGDLVQFSGTGRHGNWAYSLLQVETPHAHTRLTAGVSAGTALLFGRKSTGFMGGVEQDLNHRWMFQAD